MAAITEREKRHFEGAASQQRKVDIDKELHFEGPVAEEKYIDSDKELK
jgi:hypothetical protein